MHDTTTSTAGAREKRRRWPMALAVGTLVVGIAIGSATTSVVWASHQFTDVPNSNQFHDEITWAADHDLVNGFPDGTFKPTAPVSRQALAAILHRYNEQFEIVHHVDTFTSVTSHADTANCPAGKRALGGGGSTTQTNIMINETIVAGGSFTVRWETEDNAALTGTSDVWVLCAPST
jgi:hypothetical protein